MMEGVKKLAISVCHGQQEIGPQYVAIQMLVNDVACNLPACCFLLMLSKNGAGVRIALESIGLMMEGLEKDGHLSVPRTTRNWSTVRSYTNACP